MDKQLGLVMFALMVGFAIVAVVAIESISIAEEAEAKGCTTSVAVNASKGRCFRP